MYCRFVNITIVSLGSYSGQSAMEYGYFPYNIFSFVSSTMSWINALYPLTAFSLLALLLRTWLIFLLCWYVAMGISTSNKNMHQFTVGTTNGTYVTILYHPVCTGKKKRTPTVLKTDNVLSHIILWCCRFSFHSTLAVVIAAHHRVRGFEKSDKISENPVFSRLLTFAPILFCKLRCYYL